MIRRISSATRVALMACALALAAQVASAQSASNEHSSNASGIRTLRVAFPVAETGFDPQATSDLYSDHVQRAIFETLYGFDYLARPYRRIPRTAAELPRIEDGGRSWTIRVRPGIYFADDAAFGGKRRELIAADYVYSWKRLLDPKLRSPFSWYL